MRRKIISTVFLPVGLLLLLCSTCTRNQPSPDPNPAPIQEPSGLELLSTKFILMTKPLDINNYHQYMSKGERMSIRIPYKNARVGESYEAYEKSIEVKDQEGKPIEIKLSYPEGTVYTPTGFVKATITAVSSCYTPPAQRYSDPVNVLGKFELNTKGAHVEFCAYVGVKDRFFMIGRDCIYGVVKGPDGRTWLSNNLGADYSNMEHVLFNPAQQAKDGKDYHAFGGLHQKYRSPEDGHAYTEWTDSRTPIITGFLADNQYSNNFHPKHSKIIPIGEEVISNWTYPGIKIDPNLWAVNGENNPCPTGFRPPTMDELENLYIYVPREEKDKYLLGKSSLRVPNMPRLEWKYVADGVTDGGYYYHTYDKINETLVLSSNLDIKSIPYGTAPALPVRCIKN